MALLFLLFRWLLSGPNYRQIQPGELITFYQGVDSWHNPSAYRGIRGYVWWLQPDALALEGLGCTLVCTSHGCNGIDYILNGTKFRHKFLESL